MGIPAGRKQFGPDDNRAMSLSSNLTHTVAVAIRARARFTASVAALDENVLMVYRYDNKDGHLIQKAVLEYGNGQRSRRKNTFDSPVSTRGRPLKYLVCGWNKSVGPNDPFAPLHKWAQSKVRVNPLSTRRLVVGFEDRGGTNDYNDSLCKVQFLRPARKKAKKK